MPKRQAITAVILAGGRGTRFAEETDVRPKPMIEIGARPILWHIMKIFSSFGVADFVVCLGYKGYVIKEFFSNYLNHVSDVTIDLKSGRTVIHRNAAEPWRVTLVDTGEDTMTGGRLKRVAKYLKGAPFLFTYGDGVGDVDIRRLLDTHRRSGLLATITAVKMPGRFGSVEVRDNKAVSFNEKPHGDGGWINGGFFALQPDVLDYIDGDESIWERKPLEQLCADGQLGIFAHDGFWQPMDTLRDKLHLEQLWATGKAPWKTWR